jgi:hypothetical protein
MMSVTELLLLKGCDGVSYDRFAVDEREEFVETHPLAAAHRRR